MWKIAVALLLAWSSAATAAQPPGPSGNADCAAAIATAERSAAIPAGLLAAIGQVESGRADPVHGTVRPWPWTIDAAGAGQFFATKAEAVAATAALRRRGVESIDVGCLQVNLMHHPAAFASLDEAFDPLANALYAARFLKLLFSQTGDWPAAVAAYHSQTHEISAAYRGKVLALWTPPGSAAPPPGDSGSAGFAKPEWLMPVAAPETARSLTLLAAKPPLPERPAPAESPLWVERVIAAVARCSAAPQAGQAPGDAAVPPPALWKAAAGSCPSSPFARPAALRAVLARR